MEIAGKEGRKMTRSHYFPLQVGRLFGGWGERENFRTVFIVCKVLF
jgi:hypothetical protein